MSEEADNVKVVVRCRPLSTQEIQQGFQGAVTVSRIEKTIAVNSGKQSTVSLV